MLDLDKEMEGGMNDQVVLTGSSYLRSWQLVRIHLVHRSAARRLCEASSEWVNARDSFLEIDTLRRAIQDRVLDENSVTDEENEDSEVYGG